MLSYKISNRHFGVDLDRSYIELELEFPKNTPRLVLVRQRDIIASYRLLKNGKEICCVNNGRLESQIMPHIVDDFIDMTDISVIDKEKFSLKFYLSDLFIFKSMCYNIPPTSDDLELEICLTNDFIAYSNDDEVAIITTDYIIASNRFVLELLPHDEAEEEHQIHFEKMNIYCKETDKGCVKCFINDKNLNDVFLWIQDSFVITECNTSFFKLVSPNLYRMRTAEYGDHFINIFCNADKIFIVTVKDATLHLK